MTVELTKEQQWLGQLVGEWTYEVDASPAPGQPAERQTGTESVRSLDGVWVVCESRSDAASGSAPSTSLMTLGYDPAKGRFVGTYVAGMMPYLWIYGGELDPTETKLTMDTEGPSLTAEGQMGRYKDTIEIESADRRTLTSNFLGDDGMWNAFMTMRYQRTR